MGLDLANDFLEYCGEQYFSSWTCFCLRTMHVVRFKSPTLFWDRAYLSNKQMHACHNFIVKSIEVAKFGNDYDAMDWKWLKIFASPYENTARTRNRTETGKNDGWMKTTHWIFKCFMLVCPVFMQFIFGTRTIFVLESLEKQLLKPNAELLISFNSNRSKRHFKEILHIHTMKIQVRRDSKRKKQIELLFDSDNFFVQICHDL